MLKLYFVKRFHVGAVIWFLSELFFQILESILLRLNLLLGLLKFCEQFLAVFLLLVYYFF